MARFLLFIVAVHFNYFIEKVFLTSFYIRVLKCKYFQILLFVIGILIFVILKIILYAM